MASYEWVEVQGPTVEKALEAALAELGLPSAEEADVEVMQEPKRGLLGLGGQDAVVRVKRKERSRDGGRRGRGGSRTSSSGSGRGAPRTGDSARKDPKPRTDSESQGRNSTSRPAPAPRPGGERTGQGSRSGPRERPAPRERTPREDDDREETPIADQAADIHRFLVGLLAGFGLEGEVTERIEDDAIHIDVVGEQTEALVGPKGAIIQAVLELCRTIVQRKTMDGAKIRLDIAGYTERRREALRIYTTRLAERVKAEGGEVMLEPMNAADRKVVHDTVGEIDGVRSFSEGEEPRRSVVISAED
ncbi:MAG TPA: RNA-binding cell elongation regulator Jag/EloR [Acidimicrobiia bacterium]|nr:RNA-binding cell elongation regulator Jag/EloR [Acidimicrobiia bacterium]